LKKWDCTKTNTETNIDATKKFNEENETWFFMGDRFGGREFFCAWRALYGASETCAIQRELEVTK
jgi:hypothetical protein